MSRIAKAPIELPSGVEIKIAGSEVSVKGPKGNLVQQLLFEPVRKPAVVEPEQRIDLFQRFQLVPGNDRALDL